jgi:propionyl-CoA synthetase
MIYDSPITGAKRTISYNDMLAEVEASPPARCRDKGVGKGDRVIIYMPMVPEAPWRCWPCARIGAVHSVVFGGFAAKELATRIDDASPS